MAIEADSSMYYKLATDVINAIIAMTQRRQTDPEGKLCARLARMLNGDLSKLNASMFNDTRHQRLIERELIRAQIPYCRLTTTDNKLCFLTAKEDAARWQLIQDSIFALSPQYHKAHTIETLLKLENENTGYCYSFDLCGLDADIFTNKAYNAQRGWPVAVDESPDKKLGFAGIEFKNLTKTLIDAKISQDGTYGAIKLHQAEYDRRMQEKLVETLRESAYGDAQGDRIYVVDKYSNTGVSAKIKNGVLTMFEMRNGLTVDLPLTVDIHDYDLTKPEQEKALLAFMDKVTTDIHNPEIKENDEEYKKWKNASAKELREPEIEKAREIIRQYRTPMNGEQRKPVDLSAYTDARLSMTEDTVRLVRDSYQKEFGARDEAIREKEGRLKKIVWEKEQAGIQGDRKKQDALIKQIQALRNEIDEFTRKKLECKDYMNAAGDFLAYKQKCTKSLSQLESYIAQHVEVRADPVTKYEQERRCVLRVLQDPSLVPGFSDLLHSSDRGDLVQEITTLVNGIRVDTVQNTVAARYPERLPAPGKKEGRQKQDVRELTFR